MSGWALIIEIASWVLILSGSFFAFVGALGVWRLPEFWSRLHGASVTDSAGMILLLAGMSLQGGLTLVTVKIIIIGIFLFYHRADGHACGGQRGLCNRAQTDRGAGPDQRRR